MNANPILLQKKYARIIELFSKKEKISFDDALRFFYQSLTYQMLHDGVADMYCMSDDYLQEELTDEYNDK